ncbi:MAG: enoyl-CoA hydratase/isomerase family protein [Caulobacteraceae bacterium]|nr:enoyl-CoA hydratase/isomerase family protein [Caulobacteraceae bacterium]
MEHILLDEPRAGVKTITLNRPEALNAFTWKMYEEFTETLQSFRRDLRTRVIIVTGAGKGFCAGHDAKAGPCPWADPAYGRAYGSKISLSQLGQIPLLIRSLPQPVVCAVNGAAAGIGYSLALAADLALAGQSAKFVNSTHNAATGCELGLSYMLQKAIGTQRAAELLLTARPVPAEEAARIGLVLRAVPDAELMDAALELAERITVNVPIGIWLTKQSLWLNQSAGSLEHAMELEARAVFIAQSTEDAVDKRASFWEKRAPKFAFK